jgi:hypothetical protein
MRISGFYICGRKSILGKRLCPNWMVNSYVFTRMFGILLRIYYDVKGTVNASGMLVNKPLIANYQSIYLKYKARHVSVL